MRVRRESERARERERESEREKEKVREHQQKYHSIQKFNHGIDFGFCQLFIPTLKPGYG